MIRVFASSLPWILAATACVGIDPDGRGVAVACEPCSSDFSCAAGLMCDQESFACKSVEQMKAKVTSKGQPQCDADCWQSCLAVGTCGIGKPGGVPTCIPRAAQDCKDSEQCKKSGVKCGYSAPSAAGAVASCVQ